MTTSGPKERLFRRSREAALRHRRAQGGEEPRRKPPGPGDLFLFPETAELLWAVLERCPKGHLRAVAADVHPAIGSADVAVPPESACGALSLRCRIDVRLTAGQFDLGRRTGSLEPAVLDQARQRLLALDQGRLVGSSSEQETDREPEYQDLMKELELARAALRHRREPATADSLVPRRPFWRWGSPGSWALAAMILLAVSLALAVGRLGSPLDQPLVDPLHAWLYPRDEVRGPAKTLVLHRAASHVLLILEVSDPEPRPGYRLDMREKDSDAAVFSTVLEKTGMTEIPVVLPRRVLRAGEYVLDLYGLRDGEPAELVEDYDLRVELE